jgi:hypothetical protein
MVLNANQNNINHTGRYMGENYMHSVYCVWDYPCKIVMKPTRSQDQVECN